MFFVGVDVALLDKSFNVRTGPGRCERGLGKAGPDRYVRSDRMGEVDIFRSPVKPLGNLFLSFPLFPSHLVYVPHVLPLALLSLKRGAHVIRLRRWVEHFGQSRRRMDGRHQGWLRARNFGITLDCC